MRNHNHTNLVLSAWKWKARKKEDEKNVKSRNTLIEMNGISGPENISLIVLVLHRFATKKKSVRNVNVVVFLFHPFFFHWFIYSCFFFFSFFLLITFIWEMNTLVWPEKCLPLLCVHLHCSRFHKWFFLSLYSIEFYCFDVILISLKHAHIYWYSFFSGSNCDDRVTVRVMLGRNMPFGIGRTIAHCLVKQKV